MVQALHNRPDELGRPVPHIAPSSVPCSERHQGAVADHPCRARRNFHYCPFLPARPDVEKEDCQRGRIGQQARRKINSAWLFSLPAPEPGSEIRLRRRETPAQQPSQNRLLWLWDIQNFCGFRSVSGNQELWIWTMIRARPEDVADVRHGILDFLRLVGRKGLGFSRLRGTCPGKARRVRAAGSRHADRAGLGSGSGNRSDRRRSI